MKKRPPTVVEGRFGVSIPTGADSAATTRQAEVENDNHGKIDTHVVAFLHRMGVNANGVLVDVSCASRFGR